MIAVDSCGWVLGPQYDPMVVPAPPEEGGYSIPDLILPEEITPELIQNRKTFRKVVDNLYRSREEWAEFATLDSYEQQALNMLLSPRVKDAFDLSQELAKVRDWYGRDLIGQATLLARRLVEAGCRFVTVEGHNIGTGSYWDTHYDNDRFMADGLMPPLDRTLSVLLEDLQQRGLLESTMVLVMGEFGRTAHLNPRAGRDHWCHCWSLALGGGGIQGGQVIGASDEIGAYVAERQVTQGDLFATVYKALGIDWTKTYTGSDGRPLYIANSIGDTLGSPIKELV